MSSFAAVLDANVLYSYPLTSVLLELAEARLYRPIWSADTGAGRGSTCRWICGRNEKAPTSGAFSVRYGVR